jgi:hypothetical protein
MATTETPRLSLVLGARASEWIEALRDASWRWIGLQNGKLHWATECRPASLARESVYPVTLTQSVTAAMIFWANDAQRAWTWSAIISGGTRDDIALRLADPRTIHARWEGTLATLLGLADMEQAAPSVWATRVPAQFSWTADDSPRLTIECPGCGARLPLRYEGQPPTRMRATCDRCRLTVTYRLAYEARTPEVAWVT